MSEGERGWLFLVEVEPRAWPGQAESMLKGLEVTIRIYNRIFSFTVLCCRSMKLKTLLKARKKLECSRVQSNQIRFN